ncbi:hypothetical protein ACFQ6E_34310 [Streptomyces sp. NPDC056462]|uniref:hypothetical protein n=1 Tax=Streptomyces sp. NPDC056462 TaxID=3345826 RepID=UPI0036A7B561
MEWTALASTVVGGMIAAVTGLLVESRRWKRERGNQDAEIRRTLYGNYLASLSQARHTCSLVARDPNASPAQRRSMIHQAFDPCNAARAQMIIVAPSSTVAPSRRVYFELREFGEQVAGGLRFEDAAYGTRRVKYDELVSELIEAMRQDLDDAA